MTYEPRIDYRRKRGLVEEINRAVQDVEADAAARAALGGKHVEVSLVSCSPSRRRRTK